LQDDREIRADAARARRFGEQIEAVLFDLDGTLTKPNLDFDQVRQSLGCPHGQPVLEWILSQPTGEREELESQLMSFEMAAAKSSEPADGAVEVVQWLRQRGLKLGILTRNFREAVLLTMRRCGLDIPVLWTREDGPRKPSGEAVIGLCRRLAAAPERAVVVGDFKFDLEAAKQAGSLAVLLVNGPDVPDWADLADVVIRDLRELKGLF